MGKRSHKRQKLDTAAVQPLGSHTALHDDSAKDDEERRLEAALFGKPYTPAPPNENHVLVLSDDEGEDNAPDAEGFNEFATLNDTDLFFVDDFSAKPQGEGPSAENAKDEAEDRSDEGSDDEERQTSAAEQQNPEPSSSSSIFAPKSRKPSAWSDPDDANVQVSLAENNRLRKLRDAPDDDVVSGRDYERRLRRQYEKINPTPEWAAQARKKLHPKEKRRRSTASSDTDADEDDVDVSALLTSTGGILSRSRRKTLPKGTLSIERLRDANISARSEGAVKVVQFHPSPQLPVMLTAGEDRRLRLFNVDGHTNPHLQTVHIPDLPITNALFHPSGTNVLLTGQRPFYYSYDLQSGTVLRSPRGLWGTTFNGTNVQDGSMEICAFDPSGEVLAVAGRRGYVHLVDWRSGAGQVVGSVKMNSAVNSVWWSGGVGGRKCELMTLGEDAEVYVWDVAERRCVKRWKDEGGYGSNIICGDRSGQYLGIGSRHGLVNVYGGDSTTSASADRPKPLKTLENLTTSITSLRFNHDSQLLAMASNTKKDQMRLVHLPSLTAYSNWPTSGTPLGHVTSVDFSAGSEYVAIGNSRGRVLLYQLHDYVQS
ncbi:WD40 repeat-like protein [Panus rudis PR-1116 ss-1]|nr:WD40 repeat-like protein [Panus rudis PR-1116 ss-1]